MKGIMLRAARPKAPDDTYTLKRPSFEERVNALAGKGAWREPSDGAHGPVRILPGEHLDAAAIAYARQERGDFGPDVLIAVALGSDAHRDRCVHSLAKALASLTRARDERALMYAAMCAWDELVHGRPAKPPASLPSEVWAALLKLAVATLDSERTAAIASARRARKSA